VDLEDILISPQRGLRVLPGSSGEVDYPLLSADMQEEFFEGLLQLDERPDLILIDTAAGLSQEIVWYAARSSEVFVVTSAEPTSIMDAYAMIKVLTASDASIPVDLLLNSIRSPQEAEETVQKFRMAVKHFLKREIGYLGFVPFDQTVQKAVLQQQPVIRSFPRSAAAQAIRGIGRQWGAEQWSGSVRRAKAS
jgi:flagellar biosynthesis protein FlhG